MIQQPENRTALNETQHKRLATLWRLERADGTVFRFTDHDDPIPFSEFSTVVETYTPVGGVSLSARQLQAGLKVNNMEAKGVLTSAVITDEDLRYGLYDGAEIWEYLVDWKYPFNGAFVSSFYVIREVEWTPQGWTAQIEGRTSKLQVKRGHLYTKNCRYTLGDAACGKNIETGSGNFRVSGTVATTTNVRKVFTSAALVGLQSNNFYRYGKVVWTSGNNAGIDLISEVSKFVSASGQVTLQLDTPINIAVGDGFTIYVGCDKTYATCKSKFANGDAFGGFPHIPGNDALLQTPNAT